MDGRHLPRIVQMDEEARFRDRSITLAGVTGRNVEVPSANPLNYHQAVNDPDGCEPVVVDGKLFLPPVDRPLPLVMVVPGSLGVGDSHVGHAETLLARSEERRVGKEWRSRWLPYH